MSRRPKSYREFADELRAEGISATVLDGTKIFATAGGAGRFTLRLTIYFAPDTGRFVRAENANFGNLWSMVAVRKFFGLPAKSPLNAGLPRVTAAGAAVLNDVRASTRNGGNYRFLCGSELTAARKLVRDGLLRRVGGLNSSNYALTNLGLRWIAERGVR